MIHLRETTYLTFISNAFLFHFNRGYFLDSICARYEIACYLYLCYKISIFLSELAEYEKNVSNNIFKYKAYRYVYSLYFSYVFVLCIQHFYVLVTSYTFLCLEINLIDGKVLFYSMPKN